MNDNTYKGRPCMVEKIQIGQTIFSVISVQSDAARESVEDKIKRLILEYSASAITGNLHKTA